MNRHATWLALLLLSAAAACTKLPAPKASALPGDTLPDGITVPASWGNLVAVTVNPAFTDVEQLWFQDSTKRIHLVVFEVEGRQLNRLARVINRR